jgi:hypothetical protein
MVADEKTYDHNAKEVKKTKGKNIRVSDYAWQKIRKYCKKNGIVMGTFVENTVLSKIK